MSARTAVTRLIIMAGFALAAASFSLALPLRIPGLPVRSGLALALGQPIPYLPVAFIAGIMLMFTAAAVYELLPDPASRQGPSGRRELRPR
ncbi:MAG: hypothetical protein QN141_02835 [Armatimonadota bacterium]|nr:hypothetical protein [Armatimonadota bacterium]MDR7452571.1 hypothetical protein [Armatimonadota bacterium]MDR7468214.1 hypothetical protein [Armatimonadota bacterium]MDR7495074.1 hypothetical protein [Armatimonadota bacterium]MDR7500106.1 hypothetical protein [Armatimonadota bacterium]